MAKIFLDLEKIKRPNSGLGQFCAHLSQSILSQVDKGFVGVYVPKIAYDDYEGVEKRQWKAIHKITKVSVDTSVWHSFHQEAVYFPVDNKIKRILTIHDLNFLDKYHGKKRKKMLDKLQKLVSQSSAVVYISNFTKKIAEQHLVYPAACITKVVYNGVAIEHKQEAIRPSWVNDFSPFLFTIGIVGEKKNFHVLVEMMKHLPALKLYIAGSKSSSYANNVLQLIQKYRLENRVLLVGEVSEAEKKWLYKNCTAFVFPSKNEGFGLPVVEAMSLGKPLVLSNLTSLPEIGGDLAHYFKSFEAKGMAEVVRGAINNYDLVKKEALIKRAQKFDWNLAAKEYISIYKKLL